MAGKKQILRLASALSILASNSFVYSHLRGGDGLPIARARSDFSRLETRSVFLVVAPVVSFPDCVEELARA